MSLTDDIGRYWNSLIEAEFQIAEIEASVSRIRMNLRIERSTLLQIAPEKPYLAPAPHKDGEWPADVKKSMNRHAHAFRLDLLELAKRVFGSRYAPLDFIDDVFTAEYRDSYYYVEKFDPVAFWLKLEHTFGCGKGLLYTRQQQADIIFREFDMYQREPTWKNGRLCVITNVTTINCPASSSLFRPTNGTKKSLALLCTALSTFGEWAGMLASEIEKIAEFRQWLLLDAELTSRKRVDMTSDIQLIAFKGQFHFLFSPVLAESLMVYISTFANQYKGSH